MGQHRLNASPHIEDRNILLFLMDLNAASLNDLIKRAIQIWKECFLNHSRTRTALLIRSDKNTPHNFSKRDDGTTHKAFLKRIHERVRTMTLTSQLTIKLTMKLTVQLTIKLLINYS